MAYLQRSRNSAPHDDIFHALYCDGSVRALPVTIPPEDLRAMLTIDGGETVGY